MRLGRELFWIGVGNVVGAVGGLCGVLVLARLMEPSLYGELALGLTAATVLNQVLFGPLGNAAARHYAGASEDNNLRAYISAYGRLTLGGAILVIGIGAASAVLAAPHWGFQIAFFLFLTAGYAAVWGVNTVCDYVQNAARQRKVVALHQAALQWLRLAGAGCGLLIVPRSVLSAMAGYLVGSTVVTVSQLVILYKAVNARDDGSLPPATTAANVAVITRAATAFAVPMILWGVFTCFQLASDKWALQVWSSTADVGRYQALYQLSYFPINLVAAALLQLVTPIVFERAGSGADVNRHRKAKSAVFGITSAFFLIGVLLASLVWMASPYVVHVLPRTYSEVLSLAPLMILAGTIFASGQIVTIANLIDQNTRGLLPVKTITAVIGTALNVAGAILGGTRGVAFALLGTSSIYLIWVSMLNVPRLAEAGFTDILARLRITCGKRQNYSEEAGQ